MCSYICFMIDVSCPKLVSQYQVSAGANAKTTITSLPIAQIKGFQSTPMKKCIFKFFGNYFTVLSSGPRPLGTISPLLGSVP